MKPNDFSPAWGGNAASWRQRATVSLALVNMRGQHHPIQRCVAQTPALNACMPPGSHSSVTTENFDQVVTIGILALS